MTVAITMSVPRPEAATIAAVNSGIERLGRRRHSTRPINAISAAPINLGSTKPVLMATRAR